GSIRKNAMSTDTPSKLSIEERLLLAQAAAFDAEAALLEHKLRDQLVSGESCGQFTLTGPLAGDLPISLIAALVHWQRRDASRRQTIQINLNSEGEEDQIGESFVNTFAMFDAIRLARAAGQRVRIQVTGLAARQAAVLLQAADERVITPHSQILLS